MTRTQLPVAHTHSYAGAIDSADELEIDPVDVDTLQDDDQEPTDDALLTSFQTVLNVAQPTHGQYADRHDDYCRKHTEELYPIPRSHVDYRTSVDSSAFARCGPRRGRWSTRPEVGRTTAGGAEGDSESPSCSPAEWKTKYQVDADRVRTWSTERRLALETHEVTHISVYGQGETVTHGPAFWRHVAFHAQRVREAGHVVEQIVGDVDWREYERMVVDDVSGSADNRVQSTDAYKRDVANWLGRPELAPELEDGDDDVDEDPDYPEQARRAARLVDAPAIETDAKIRFRWAPSYRRHDTTSEICRVTSVDDGTIRLYTNMSIITVVHDPDRAELDRKAGEILSDGRRIGWLLESTQAELGRTTAGGAGRDH